MREFYPHYLEASHPYGCRTHGDAFFFSGSRYDDCFLRLGDEPFLALLSFLEASTLTRLSAVNRLCYVFCNHSELWRDLALHHFQTLGRPVEFHYGWRDTLITLLRGQGQPRHSPLLVDGVFSTTLTRSWACIAYELDLSFPKFYALDNVLKVDAREMSYSSFLEKYEITNTPVVISNAISGWSALSKWTDEYLSDICGDKLFRATSAMASHSASFTMRQYLLYSKQCKDEVPLYLFERDFASNESLRNDFSVPSFFDPTLHPNTDLLRLFGEARPDHRWLIIGPKKSGSIFHIDPNMTHAWNAVIRGRKKWIFYPRHVSPPVSQTLDDDSCFGDEESHCFAFRILQILH